ncbi:uncharacterized protein PGTG_14962 [Puccinia graminis f. sp. tritici CRL 75-36-700-3]|uniref:Uncharacterized protein n=1 Tax=Puccinia graminis f. sp. tritici (strain CRL 75-36-700-3 / race SCCL) TaxID=418459 RepID=E3KXQ9_PUCGT|nr:uncharacterized protein PGTG_14962 [Puccinia graminis f. sp. tritici CRL 75-36-700-3]EFP89121.1 hypothetical protein PGTG_14962 [Puccinia graminis f. sp. tritici CRL 75-36-700-3]
MSCGLKLKPKIPNEISRARNPPSLETPSLESVMRQASKRQQLIKDIFLILVFLDLEDTDNHLDQVLNIQHQPSFGSILFPNYPNLQVACDRFLGDEAWLEALLQAILSCRYLNDCSAPTTHGSFDLDRLFNLCAEDFKQSVRTTKEAFLWLLDQISLHPVFHSQSHWPQLPIPHQLALTLERLGLNGNGALVGRFLCNLTVGQGTVIKCGPIDIKEAKSQK